MVMLVLGRVDFRGNNVALRVDPFKYANFAASMSHQKAHQSAHESAHQCALCSDHVVTLEIHVPYVWITDGFLN